MMKSHNENSEKYDIVEYLELDEDEDNETITEKLAILNPYTGQLELDLCDSEVKCMERDTPENKVEEKTVVRKIEQIPDNCRKKHWRDTNKQEWLNIYQQYMQDRVTGKHTVSRPSRTSPQRRKEPTKKVNGNKLRSDMESIEIGSNNGEYSDVEYLMDEYDEGTQNDLNSQEAAENDSDTESIEIKDNDEEYRDVEYLVEELMAPRNEATQSPKSPETSIRGRKASSSLRAALHSVCRRDISVVRAARLHRVPLCLLYEHLQRLRAGRFALQRKRIKSLNKHGRLCDNSLKLLKNSNICVFKWTSEYLACFCCLQHFKHMSMLRAHTKSSHNYKEIRSKILSSTGLFHKADISDLKCAICNVTLDDLNELQRHLKTHGRKVKIEECSLVPYKLCTDLFTCQLCFEVLDSKEILKVHMKKHLMTHICDACDRRFSSRKSLWIHKCVPTVRFKCIICNEVLKSSYARRRHETEVHGFEYKRSTYRFKCKFCSQTFKHNYKRLEHLVEAHKGKNSLFQCSFCPRNFMTAHWCTKHMNIAHAEEMMS